MSAKVTIWAWAQAPRLGDSTTLIVLLGMADIVRDHGRYYGTQQTLAEKVKMTVRTVRRSIATLAEIGVISVEPRRGRTDVIQMKLSPVTIFAEGPEEDDGWDETPDIDGRTPDIEAHTPDSESYDPGNLPQKINPKNAPGREGVLFPQGGPAFEEPDQDRFHEAWSLWPRAGRLRSAKTKAQQAWAKLAKTRGGQATLIVGIQRYIASPDATKDGGQYVPALERWLRDGRWEVWAAEEGTPKPRTGADDWQ